MGEDYRWARHAVCGQRADYPGCMGDPLILDPSSRTAKSSQVVKKSSTVVRRRGNRVVGLVSAGSPFASSLFLGTVRADATSLRASSGKFGVDIGPSSRLRGFASRRHSVSSSCLGGGRPFPANDQEVC